MNRILSLILLALLAFAILPGCSKIEAGNVGVKVKLLGSDKGVNNNEILGPGRYYIGWNEELYRFPTFTQITQWTKNPDEGSPTDESITFDSEESLSINVDIGVSYHVEEAKVGLLFQKYRKGIEEITNKELRNVVRDAFTDAASTRKAADIIGRDKADFLAAVHKKAYDTLASYGIIIERISIIGSMRPPASLTEAINLKVEAIQKAEQRQNELAEAVAAAEKIKAEADGRASAILSVAKAQAEANVLLAESVTDKLVKYEMMKKWDGVLPKVSGDGGLINMVDLNK